jgi:hypothetical protein
MVNTCVYCRHNDNKIYLKLYISIRIYQGKHFEFENIDQRLGKAGAMGRLIHTVL